MGALKQKIQDQTLLPVTKQKLAVEGIFVKDQNTLAYYNMFMNKVVQLGVKERGGKKK
jgi:splicing factor 3A subunit 1